MDLETVRKQAVEKAQMQDLGLVYDETQDGYVDATSLKGPPVDEYVDEFGGRDAIKAFDALTFEERISPGDGEEQLTEEDKKMLADLDKRLDELKNVSVLSRTMYSCFHPASYIVHRTLYIVHRTSYIVHRTSYIVNLIQPPLRT